MEAVTALIGALSLIAVAVIERRTRNSDDKWEQNSSDHKALADRVEDIGKSLGRSLDRVEDNIAMHIIRLENKVEQHDDVLYGHLAHHAELEANRKPRKRASK
jgi:hypothetical protein